MKCSILVYAVTIKYHWFSPTFLYYSRQKTKNVTLLSQIFLHNTNKSITFAVDFIFMPFHLSNEQGVVFNFLSNYFVRGANIVLAPPFFITPQQP